MSRDQETNRRQAKAIRTIICRIKGSEKYLVVVEDLLCGKIVEETYVLNIGELVEFIKRMDSKCNKNRKYFA